MNERKDIEFPVWRKKVDSSFLNEQVTPIPKWLWNIWSIDSIFYGLKSKDAESKVTISFEGETYPGNVFFSSSSGRDFCRLKFDPKLHTQLKETFLMSYMRSLEGQIRQDGKDIELEIPFWEFIDIEFDSQSKQFRFTSHYNHQPYFPELFKQLVSSPAIKKIDDSIDEKSSDRIHKQDWRPRADYKREIGAENVIYTLIDTKNQLIYIGEAKKLIARFDNGHPDISDWDFYKYNVLPESLESFRLTIERMAIRDMANFLSNKSDIPHIEISAFKLANRKIDK